jgi:hypothetical protein
VLVEINVAAQKAELNQGNQVVSIKLGALKQKKRIR